MSYDLKDAVGSQLKQFPEAEYDILYFIERFRRGGGASLEQQEVVRRTFMSGYCLYFALMLKEAFPSGEICWAAPYGHIVYVYNGIPYDIEGRSITESDHFIPISYLGNTIDDFRHINGVAHNTTKQELDTIIQKYVKDQENMRTEVNYENKENSNERSGTECITEDKENC